MKRVAEKDKRLTGGDQVYEKVKVAIWKPVNFIDDDEGADLVRAVSQVLTRQFSVAESLRSVFHCSRRAVVGTMTM